ncbi:signal peptide peptidase A. Serine peptidase. MEROPS family S49 [Desulfonatronum thiosulfatophilum]|uniref:Signal peptide peptidase A. Serine peptidase. MEROPS family S49 n=2 Tax=Desulfonatronum thiosulfatophilum TaxID=617002 RepID=A0A1G6CAF2_9BACT|nr:signal peptide peptidase A. Serine peptidase. MEROPS family S49 [Desulfonatronum thiosulfatophilum]
MFTAVALFSGVMAVWRSYAEKHPESFLSFGKPKIGLVHVEGMIVDATDTLNWIRRLREDPGVKAVLVRIDSPGGVVGPSQELHGALERLRDKKPVVVSMGAVAASGGYYIAVAGDKIVANPGTLTGSIGVRMELTNLQGLMEKLGIRRHAIASGQFKTTGSPFEELTEHERAYLEAVVMDMHGQFVRAISAGRDLTLEDVEKVADGRIMTGLQALEYGLVDVLGGREEALELLRALAGIDDHFDLIEDPTRQRPIWKRILGSVEDELRIQGPVWVFK